MEKTKLKIKSHTVLPDNLIVEIWYEDKLIGSIYGGDGPGVRVISKYPMSRSTLSTGNVINTMEVRIDPKEIA